MQTYTSHPPPLSPDEREAPSRRYILIPLDGSAAAESILAHALLLARISHSGLLLLYVIGPPSLWETMSPVWSLYPHLARQDEEHWAREYLATIAARLQTSDVPVRMIVAHGRPGPVIIAITKRFPHILLLAVATHARPGFLRNLLSPVLAHVIRETTIPVFIVKTRRHQPPIDAQTPSYGVIAVPLDIPMRTGEALAKALLIAQATGGTLVLATFSPSRAEAPQALHIAQWATQAESRTLPGDATTRDLHMRKIVVQGRFSQALLQFCRQEKPDMLVMAPKDCRHFTPRWLASVGRRIIHELAIPVLMVPPEA